MNIFIKYHLLIVFISIDLTSITLYKYLRFFKKLKICEGFASSFLRRLRDGFACLLRTPGLDCNRSAVYLRPFKHLQCNFLQK